MRTRRPAPVILTDRSGLTDLTLVQRYGETQAKTHTGATKAHRQVAQVIHGHQFHRLGGENTHTVQFTTIEHHQAEAHIVLCG